MLNLKSSGDLQRLIDDEIQESLTLDYKASPSLAKDSKSRDELCKDVSAFANSAGGQIIYGIEEINHKPVVIDAGSDVSREWIEQVIDSNIQPRIEGLIIAPIPISKGRYSYVLTIPQAVGRAPHQAPDNKYYRRQNFQSVPMEDYEVKDTIRRGTISQLDVSVGFLSGTRLQFRQEFSDPISIEYTVSNTSSTPADYAILRAYFDAYLTPVNQGDFEPRIEPIECFGGDPATSC